MKTLLLILALLPVTVLADHAPAHHDYRYDYRYRQNYNQSNFWNGLAAGALLGGIGGYALTPRPYYPPVYPYAPPPAYRPVWDAYCQCYVSLPVYPY